MGALTVVPPVVAPSSATPDLHGVHLVQHHSMFYPPAVTPTDVLEIDFDQKSIGPDGLYVIDYPATDQSPSGCGWTGVRRFCWAPGSRLKIHEGDEWRSITAGHRNMRVFGRIVNVYRRTNG
jgi:hypothetical protein